MRTFFTGLALLLASPVLLASTIYKYVDSNGVVTYTDKETKGAEIFVFRDAMVETFDKDVYVTTDKHAGGETRSRCRATQLQLQAEARRG